MTLGIPLSTFTAIHVIISLIGIASGLVVLFGLITARRLDRWTAIFLLTTILTSVTGFGFPFERLLPSHIIGIISLVVLTIACIARYGRHLVGAWRWIYVVSAILALYFNIFVLVVQMYQKIPVLKALAPTQTETPFKIAQLAVLVLFVVLGIAAVRKFHPAQASSAAKAG